MQLWFPSVLDQTPPDTTKYPFNSHCQDPAVQVQVKKHSDGNQTEEACPLELVHQYIYIYIHSNSLCAETVFFFLSTSLASSIFLQRRRRNQQKVQLQRHSKCSYGFHRFCTKPHQIQPNTHPTRTARVLQRKLKSKPTQTGTRRSRHAVGILLAVIYHYISGLFFLRVCLKVFGSVG